MTKLVECPKDSFATSDVLVGAQRAAPATRYSRSISGTVH